MASPNLEKNAKLADSTENIYRHTPQRAPATLAQVWESNQFFKHLEHQVEITKVEITKISERL